MKIIFICPCSDRFYRRSLECGKREKKHAPVQGVSTSAWKSPLELKEWFCTVDLNLKKNETNDADTFIIHDTAVCLHFRLDRLLYA